VTQEQTDNRGNGPAYPALSLFSALDKRFWHIISLDLPAEAATTAAAAAG